ncbi:hypothetical protein AN958_11423 [Leucoagaricus sp. SymC.cos]|nr:hypothetical protein AN958_11423 [Leucoagaricus sp. SymC.cos]
MTDKPDYLTLSPASMSKRSLSPQGLPAAKRLHTLHSKPPDNHLSIVDVLYDELILTILSYLSWFDLCATQLINRNWARLAVDSELWRRQYILVFGKPRLRGARGQPGRFDGREVKPLPSRARIVDSAYKDWKWMFRISSNWRKGRCSVEELPCAAQPEIPQPLETSSNFNRHLLLTGTLTITASSQPSTGSAIYITSPTESCSVVCRSSNGIPCSIMTLTIDQSAPTLDHHRFLSFLSSGDFFCYQIQHNPLSASRQFQGTIATRRSPSHPVVQAAYHHPLLVTLSRDFTISLYNVVNEALSLTQTLSSFTSFPPVSLVLSTPSPSTYKLVLAYAIPVYPRHWTAGATELMISGVTMTANLTPRPSNPDSLHSLTSPSQSQMTVLSTRTARAVDVPFGWIDERKLRIMREQWSRKVNRVADIQTDGKWVILAPGDQLAGLGDCLASPDSAFDSSYPSPIFRTNKLDDIQMNASTASSLHSPTSLQLYRLIFPPHNSVSSSPPRLSFVRTLHGQTGPVTTLSLADGRCVSLSLNGSIWVWDLEAGTGAEVAAASLEFINGLAFGPDSEPVKGSVSFDERRLIIAQRDNVVIRRFDV